MPSASDRQAAEAEPDSGVLAAAAHGVAAAGGAASTTVANVLAQPSPSGQKQPQGFVDMLLSAREVPREPLVAWVLKRPGNIPVSAEQTAPDAAACWEKRVAGGALSSYPHCIAADVTKHALRSKHAWSGQALSFKPMLACR